MSARTQRPGRVRRTSTQYVPPPAAPLAPTAAADDGALALALFDRLFPARSWRAWRVWVLAFFGLGHLMTLADLDIFRQCTGRTNPPTTPATRANNVISRRSGKSMVLGRFLIPFYAAVKQHQLARGERGVVQAVAPDRRQAGVLLDYADAGLADIPGAVGTRRTTDTIGLKNGVEITVQTANFRSVRGFSVLAAIVDEAAFLPQEDSATPDVELVRALLPAVATTGGPLILSSSPYAQRGVMFRTDERYYGREDSDIMCWRAPSLLMNPTLPESIVIKAREDDPAGAASEWDGAFRVDIEELFPREALVAVVVPNRFELAPQSGVPYIGFCDPSGGSADSMTLAIAHRDVTGKAILDLLREVKPPFSPEATVLAFARELKRYNVRATYSDAYGGDWVREAFAKAGITITLSPLVRSEIYLNALPLINSGLVELLDSPRLVTQLGTLERRTGRSGKDAVDHPRGGHDDVANSACGALVMAVRSIGLRAALPSAFTECVNPAAAERCAFLFNGAWFPSDGHCRRECPRLRAVLGSYREACNAAVAAGEEQPTARKFLDERFDIESSPLTKRAAWQQLREDMENMYGV
jgi:hypothetical protein